MSKPFWASKTIWIAVLAPLFGLLATKYGFHVPPETQEAVAEAMSGMAVAFIANRFTTTEPIHVVTPKVDPPANG